MSLSLCTSVCLSYVLLLLLLYIGLDFCPVNANAPAYSYFTLVSKLYLYSRTQSSIHGGACVVMMMMINTLTYCRFSKVPRQLDELQQ